LDYEPLATESHSARRMLRKTAAVCSEGSAPSSSRNSFRQFANTRNASAIAGDGVRAHQCLTRHFIERLRREHVGRMLDAELVLAVSKADCGQHEQRTAPHAQQLCALLLDPEALFIRQERLPRDRRGHICRSPRIGQRVAPQRALGTIDCRACFFNVDPRRWNAS
jgi:hypothetical protein